MAKNNLIFIIFIITTSTMIISLKNAQQIDITNNKEEMSIDNQLNDLNNDTQPYIEGDQIIETRRGKSISMKCVVHNLKNYKIAWYFNGIILGLGNLRIRDDKRISVENVIPNEWKLNIESITETDEGYYSCRTSTGLKKIMFLRVGVPPKFTKFTNGNTSSHQVVIDTVEHQNITLTCEAEGNPVPTIYWYKNNELITTGIHLNLINISRYSHSEYECVARNKIEPDPSRHFKLNINFEPIINLMYHLKEHKKKLHYSYNSNSNVDFYRPSDAENLINDGELQFVCEIHANPIHSINWFKDGSKLKDESGGKFLTIKAINEHLKKKKKSLTIHTNQVKPHKFISKLKIKNVNSNDNGLYECVVNGYEGSNVSRSVSVNVINTKIENENDPVLRKIISKIEENENSEQQLLAVESNFLFHGRGARSNLTKSDDSSYDFNEINSSRRLDSLLNIKLITFSFLIIYIFKIF